MKQICYKFPTSNIISLLTMKYKKKKKAVVSRQNIFLTSSCAQMFSSLSVIIDSRGLVHPFWTIHSRKKVRFKTVFPLSFLRVYFQLPLKRPRKEGYTFDFERSTNFFVLCPIQRKKRQKSLKPNHYKMWWEGKPFFSTFSLSKAKLFLKEIGN